MDIAAGHRAWGLSLDLIVASADGGNILDAAAIAARTALKDLRIPETQSTTVQSTQAATKVESGRRAGHFDLVSHHDLGRPLSTRERLPVPVTLSLLGSETLVDADEIEASAASTGLSLGVQFDGSITHIRQTGDGELEWSALSAAFEVRSADLAQR